MKRSCWLLLWMAACCAGAYADEITDAMLTRQCNLNIRYLLASEQLRFTASSATLARSNAGLLDTIAEIAASCPRANIVVEGHSDAHGDERWNRQLSRLRAQHAAESIAGRGIAMARFTVVGYGSARPIADNTTRDGRALNRRIGIRFSDPEADLPQRTSSTGIEKRISVSRVPADPDG